eukprot:9482752-Pyramimonas_sp.AAC.1
MLAPQVIDPTLPMDSDDVAALLADLTVRVRGCRALGMCGTLPPGVDANFYRDLVRVGGPPLCAVSLPPSGPPLYVVILSVLHSLV